MKLTLKKFFFCDYDEEFICMRKSSYFYKFVRYYKNEKGGMYPSLTEYHCRCKDHLMNRTWTEISEDEYLTYLVLEK